MLSRYKWLIEATSKIQFPPDRKAVQRELSGHIEDLCGHYAAAGLDEEAAEAAALKAMGDPRAIAADLGRIHRPWLGYLWWASKALLILAMAVCAVLSITQIFRNPIQTPLDHLPGWEYYDYLTWEFAPASEYSEQYDLLSNGAVTAGGYTIRTDRAVMGRREDFCWNLYLSFHIDTGWRGEELYWGPNVITEVRDDSGNVYSGWSGESEKYYRHDSSSAALFLGQKGALELNDVPEGTEWVELTIGYGALQRILHIDIKEAAA